MKLSIFGELLVVRPASGAEKDRKNRSVFGPEREVVAGQFCCKVLKEKGEGKHTGTLFRHQKQVRYQSPKNVVPEEDRRFAGPEKRQQKIQLF